MTAAAHKTDAYVYGKMQPQALELEQAVLGALMIDRDALGGVIDLLKPESFYTAAHQEIYRACLKLYGKGEAIDLLTVSEQLRVNGKMQIVGGSDVLADITNRVANSANLEFHSRIIMQKALQRDIINVCSETISTAYDETADAFEVWNDVQGKLFGLANFGGRIPESVGRIGTGVLKQLEKSMQAPDGITGIPSGLMAVDKTTGGWQPSDLIILAARPGMGKTAFVLCAALHAAKQGQPVAFFSLEMNKAQLVQRIIAMETGISITSMRTGKITTDDLRRIAEATQKLHGLPFYIDDTAGLSLFELRAKARRLKMQHGIALVIADYLQLMTGDKDRNGNREQEISSISRGCKHLAKDLNVPVIALSQLSRAVEIRGGAKRPQLSDLRESGAIEQDADMVGFLYRPEYYGINEDENGVSTAGLCELNIAKHRHGALENIGLFFDGPTTKFTDMSTSNQFPTAPAAIPQAIPAGARPGLNDEDIPF